MAETPSKAADWVQRNAVAILGAFLFAGATGAGGTTLGYVGGSQVESYRLAELEREVQELKAANAGERANLDQALQEIRTGLANITQAMAVQTADAWSSSDHGAWEKGVYRLDQQATQARLMDYEIRLRALEGRR